jgi:hypothetical protein
MEVLGQQYNRWLPDGTYKVGHLDGLYASAQFKRAESCNAIRIVSTGLQWASHASVWAGDTDGTHSAPAGPSSTMLAHSVRPSRLPCWLPTRPPLLQEASLPPPVAQRMQRQSGVCRHPAAGLSQGTTGVVEGDHTWSAPRQHKHQQLEQVEAK